MPRLLHLAISLLALLALLALCACDGRSGSSGVLPSGDPGGETTTTVKASVALTYALARAPVSPTAVDPVEAAYQAAAVTLTLPDGRSFTMTYNGNGEYSCLVSNLPDGVAGYIEAEINQMTLKAFFDDLFASQSVLDAGQVGADSTFAADVLSSFAEALSGGPLDPSQILSGVAGATLAIDIQSLNAQATDGTSVDYELARRTYRNVLTWDNIDLTSGQIAGLIGGDPQVQNLRDAIAGGAVTPPAAGGPVEEAKAFARLLLEAYFNTRTTASLLPYLSATDFLWSGLDRTGFTARAVTEWSADPLFSGGPTFDFTNTIVSVSPATDFTGTGLTMWLVTLEGTFDAVFPSGVTVTRSFSGGVRSVYVANAGGTWKAFGDRRKMTFDYQIGYFNSNDPGRFTEITVTAVAGGVLPDSVSMALGPQVDPYAVGSSEVSPEKYGFLLSGGPGSTWRYQSPGYSSDTGFSYAGLDGVVMTVTADFSGDIAEFRRVIEIRSPTTVVTEFTPNPDGSLTLGWRPPSIDERIIRTEITFPRHGLSYDLPPSARAFTVPEPDLTAAGVTQFDPDYVDVICHTPTARYGYRQYFTLGGQLIDIGGN